RQLLDDTGLPHVRLREVERRLTRVDAELAEALLRLLEQVGGLHPGLRRDAPDPKAGAAELGLLVDADDPGAELRSPNRRRVAAGAAAENGNVAVHASSLSTGLLAERRAHDHRVALLANRLEPVPLVELDRRVGLLDTQADGGEPLAACAVEETRQELRPDAAAAHARDDRDRRLRGRLVDEREPRLVGAKEAVPRRAHAPGILDRDHRRIPPAPPAYHATRH